MVHVGTCSWAEKTLVASPDFYPPTARNAEARLRYYASHFDTVEVDSTYYAIPDLKTVWLWETRTPGDFIFHVKVYGALTGHAIDPATLPADLRALAGRGFGSPGLCAGDGRCWPLSLGGSPMSLRRSSGRASWGYSSSSSRPGSTTRRATSTTSCCAGSLWRPCLLPSSSVTVAGSPRQRRPQCSLFCASTA